MKNLRRKILMLCVCVMGCALWVHVSGQTALAGEDGNWRSTYDTIMMWVNFGILAFVIVKFGKKPITNFLRGQKEEIAREIQRMEDEKKNVTAKIAETRKRINESDAHFEEVKTRFIEQGIRNKQAIIDDAKNQSQVMMNMAKQRIGSQITSARQKFKEEMVDAAMEIASKQLPAIITDQDNQRLMDLYLKRTSS
jgi:F-type H+-transporting ATPase subunit b